MLTMMQSVTITKRASKAEERKAKEPLLVEYPVFTEQPKFLIYVFTLETVPLVIQSM